VEDARRGVITHLTYHGERVAAIVPDAAMDEPGESIPWEQVRAELDL
jgi:hypothetical protein